MPSALASTKSVTNLHRGLLIRLADQYRRLVGFVPEGVL